MIRPYIRLLTLAFAGSLLLPLVTVISTKLIKDPAALHDSLPKYVAWMVGALLATLAARYALRRLEPALEWTAIAQTQFLGTIPNRYVNLAIVAAAALSLFAELSVIRWQATVFPFFALYKNLSMLACFAGLGLGYAVARRPLPLFLTVPLFTWQFLLLIGMRYGLSDRQLKSLFISPFREQLNMGLENVFRYGLQNYFAIAIIFLLTALTFLPIGQLCGLLMERRDKLTAYGLNLMGSLAGVLLIFLVSALWLPPSMWFLLTVGTLLLFYVRQRKTLIVVCSVDAFLSYSVLRDSHVFLSLHVPNSSRDASARDIRRHSRTPRKVPQSIIGLTL